MKNKLQISILIATLSLILGMSNVAHAQAPNLGTASDFVLFTTVGAVTNTGISHVTGNVGSNNGAVTGFGNVNGVMTYTSDLKSAQCSADLLIAYGQLNATIPTFFPSSTLGGDTLIPGIYSITGASTLNGTLVLNANDDPNAVFIFKIFGPFSTTANSQIKLINGALACNVYWQVEGLVSMASGTNMKGTLIVHNAAINMYTGVNLEGRALSIAGAVSVNGVKAYTPIGCGSPILTGPIAPNLSSVECYAIFSSDGPVANAGISFVTGDVGTNVGLTSGFNPLNVTGDIHPIPDGSTTVAASDLLNAYTYLNALPHDIELLYPAQFGNSLVLTPHTYLMNAAVSLTDTVFLNGMGDSNAVFIIKTYGAFLTSTYSQVVLTNGTKAENVYWLVSGMVTINDYSTFNGTVISNNGAINLNTGATINGRILTTNGAIATAAVTAIMPPGCFAALAAVITTEPIDVTACEGSSTELTVVATGTGLTYQWRKGDVNLVNGVNITGATSDTLRINPVNLSDTASNYNVIVVSLSGNDTSEYVTLTVNPETLISLEPINIIASEGDSIALSVTAVGTGLNYQWRKGNTILTNGVSISGANTATLIINPVSMLDTANNYNVIVTGFCGIDTSINVSLTLSLIVDSSAVIVVQPENKNICLGGSVFFTVSATGANLTYQWRKGDVNLIDGGNISGVNTDTLWINPVLITDTASNYNVVITGGTSGTSGTSGPSTVTLNSAGDYGILSGVGISSTGFSVITDLNIGISPGFRSQIVGFPPATVVNGSIFASDDVAPPGVGAMLAQAKLDLTNAYLFAEGATAPAPVTVAGDQGGLTLAPGIYKSTSTLLIQSGDLTLDAQGDPNATWIFQIASDFTTIGGAGGNVILAGGAQAKNVIWQVGSSATIGNYTSFKGTILALTSITMNTGSTIDGRLLARNGAVVLSGTNLINKPANTISTDTNIVSVYFSLTVNPPTIITVEPINVTVCAGSSATFSVAATGSNLTYQWRKGTVNLINTGNITGATSATLTINPVNALDAATNYNVIVSGLCGNDTSLNVSLIVNPATLITVEPINMIASVGSTVEYTVTATGAGLTYQWRKGTVNLINNSNISGATSDTLTISPVGLLDAATDYNVIVSGICGNDTSIYVSLNVNALTVIILEPTNDTTCIGSSVDFTVTATGASLTYQWRKGNVNLTNNGNISGATSATLTINPVALIDAATDYNVIVSGLSGNDTSINVSLTVNPETIITVEPINVTVCAGSSATFNVTATGSNLTYQWRKGTVNLTNNGNISGATSATLTINPVSATDAATNYNVIVTGLCGNDTSSFATLTVNPATLITVEPINATVCAGSSATFNVTATGNTLTYQWRKGTVNLTNTGNITGVTSATLTIDPVSATDAATNYNVIVTGLCGNDTSSNVTLTVNTVPIANASSNSPVCEGSDIELSATTVTGATYAWTSTTGFTSALQNPTIANATLSDGGTYTLVVSANSCNSLPSSTIVAVDICYANLSVTKTASNVNPLVGTTITFTIVVTNNGPTDATGVWVNEVLESGYVFVSSTVTAGAYDPITGIWTIGSMANGSTATMIITVTVIANGTYTNTVTVYGNEPDAILPDNTSTIETFPIDFYIPEGFSPNGDGINDLFVIRGILYYPNNTFAVFNRWGEKVFDANPYQSTWSGNCTTGISIGGDLLPTGTYFYVLDLNNGSEPFKGTIYLIR